MSKIQTRRTVSISADLLARFEEAAAKEGMATSRLLTNLIEGKSNKTGHSGPQTKKPKGEAGLKPRGRYIVNTDLMLLAASEKKAEEKARKLAQSVGLECIVVGVDNDDNYVKPPPLITKGMDLKIDL